MNMPNFLAFVEVLSLHHLLPSLSKYFLWPIPLKQIQLFIKPFLRCPAESHHFLSESQSACLCGIGHILHGIRIMSSLVSFLVPQTLDCGDQ